MKTSRLIAFALLQSAAVCCAQADEVWQATPPTPGASAPTPGVAAVERTVPQQPGRAASPAEILAQPPSVGAVEPEVLPPIAPCCITVEALIETGLANNPTLPQAAARVNAMRGRWVQAGLPPNPTVGYLGSELGNDGRGGQNGGFAGQEFITGGKLRLDRAVVAREIERAEQQLAATQVRITTDIRRACYAVLVAERRMALAEDLLTRSSRIVERTRKLVPYEFPESVLSQFLLEQQGIQVLRRSARIDYNAAWQELTAVIGLDMPPQCIHDDITQLPPDLDWHDQLARVTALSPEAATAAVDVMRAEAALRRAAAEPIPNVTTQVSVQYDESSNNTIAGMQAGIPLPLWNQNQGGIRQAQADIAAARRNVARVELELQQRLALTFQAYATARAEVELYGAAIPMAVQAIEQVQRGYEATEDVQYLEILTAQRTYWQTNLAYLDALAAFWASYADIEGLLLRGSLASPPE